MQKLLELSGKVMWDGSEVITKEIVTEKTKKFSFALIIWTIDQVVFEVYLYKPAFSIFFLFHLELIFF